jgi:hypothetical protein
MARFVERDAERRAARNVPMEKELWSARPLQQKSGGVIVNDK